MLLMGLPRSGLGYTERYKVELIKRRILTDIAAFFLTHRAPVAASVIGARYGFACGGIPYPWQDVLSELEAEGRVDIAMTPRLGRLISVVPGHWHWGRAKR